MLVTELGIATEVRPDSEKAFSPMLFTELGMVTDVRLVQLWKAPLFMVVTELGMVTECK